MTIEPYSYALLPERSLLHLSGKDAFAFLQRLITADMHKISDSQGLYALMLTPQGKYLFDMFIAKAPSVGYYVDVPRSALDHTTALWRRYVLRSDVSIDLLKRWHVLALLEDSTHIHPQELCCFEDPRTPKMGRRLFCNEKKVYDLNAEQTPYENYLKQRIACGLAEHTDLAPEKSFPFHFDLHTHHAIDLTKGCYVGQEVITRTLLRGVVRKGIYVIQTKTLLPDGDGRIVDTAEKPLGTLLSRHQTVGLAQLNHAAANASTEVYIRINEQSICGKLLDLKCR